MAHLSPSSPGSSRPEGSSTWRQRITGWLLLVLLLSLLLISRSQV